MNIFFLLKTQWEFFGLRAPAFSWVASAGIIAYFIMVYCDNGGSQEFDSGPFLSPTKDSNRFRQGNLWNKATVFHAISMMK